jgi:hypothetical protein
MGLPIEPCLCSYECGERFFGRPLSQDEKAALPKCKTKEPGFVCGLCDHGQGELQRLRAEVDRLEARKAVLLGTLGACAHVFKSIIGALGSNLPDMAKGYARDGLTETYNTGGGE